MASRVRVDINTNNISKKKLNVTKQSKSILKNEVVKDTHRFVPYEKGPLSNSPSLNHDDSTIVYSRKSETGVEIAKVQYYGLDFKHRRPGTCAQWFERAKGINLNKWVNVVRKVFKSEYK